MKSSVLVVGAGLAAAHVVSGLTDGGWRGSVTVIGDESRAPYQRPPLSKDYLRGTMRGDQLDVRARDFYDERGAELVLGDAVVDLGLRSDGTGVARTASGSTVGYERLVLSTGARPRRLGMFAGMTGVHDLRTADDADRLRATLGAGVRVVVLGAGFVGLEVAATAHALGCDVTVIEAGPRVLGRVAGPVVAEHVAAHHVERGVALRTGVTAVAARSRGGHVAQVELSDGSLLDADVVLVGIGAEPRVQLAAAAGLECARGVLVDGRAVTSDGTTLAVGDCAVGRDGVRFESVDNAIQGAAAAVATLLGRSAPSRTAPWFWSDQGDLKLQMVGVLAADDSRIVRRSPDGAKLACVYYREGRIAAAEVVNAPADFVALRKAVAVGMSLDPTMVADPETRLARLVAAVPA